ncbi:MAG: low molecular weight phosphotyrosine protein phosphatase [Bacteroidetes bacterium]|nr:low molecular weight phosphotyrosine protein phosphatase [Bacteroidota bacterium]
MNILMVCLGNICRSPLAEGIMIEKLRKAGKNYFVDSAGTGGWHSGESPDQRSITIAAKHDIAIDHQRARKIHIDDFKRFDLVLAMDSSVYHDLIKIAPPESQNKVQLFLKYAGMGDRDVPDPWYGEAEDFRKVFDLIDTACENIAHKLLTNNS